MLRVLPLHGSHELVQFHNLFACYLLLQVTKKTTTKVSVCSKSHRIDTPSPLQRCDTNQLKINPDYIHEFTLTPINSASLAKLPKD
jgi:hypothetical protein